MVTVRVEDLELAFQFVSGGAPLEHEAFLSLDSGEIYFRSALGTLNELPPEFDESDRYLAIPHKSELDLGIVLVREFIACEIPNDADEVERMFRARGAYRRYKALLERRGVLDAWYEFEAVRTRRALEAWSAEQGIRLLPDSDRSTS